MPTIRFDTIPVKIGNWTIIKLPGAASAKLPSRWMTLVYGTINGFDSRIVLEPDGNGSHWFKVGSELREAACIVEGDSVPIAVIPSKDWPEPELSEDLKKALASDSQARALWDKITPMARWDWIRWIRSTNNRKTRSRRIKVALSKLNAGKRRPCCFNRNMCTVPQVSKNGLLIESKKTTK